MTHPSTPKREAAISRAAYTWILVAAGLIVYAGSLSHPFVFDDHPHIVRDRSIEQLWPPRSFESGRHRPLTHLTLVLNYALTGRSPAGFRAVNIAIHIAAGLVLYGLVRRILLHLGFPHRPGEGQFAYSADQIALAVALLWLVHPLQVQAVTYIIQRAESLMGLFYLLTLYFVTRAATAPGGCGGWSAAAVASCAAGMATKEVAVTAPIAAFLLDGACLSSSWRDAIRKRWPLYMGLAATWILLAVIVGYRRLFVVSTGTVGFGAQGIHTVTAIEYARSQPAVILHYLRVALWPYPLCFDHGWPAAANWSQVVLPSAAVGLMLATGLVALFRRSWIGVAIVTFFLILAPSSSIVPIADLAVEHRVYLSLACVVVLVVGLAVRIVQRIGDQAPRYGVWLLGAVACILGLLTIARNRDFRTEADLWATVVQTAPRNFRGHSNLAKLALDQAREATARGATRDRTAVTTAPLNSGELVDFAVHHYRIASKLKPDVADFHFDLARALMDASAENKRRIDRAKTLDDRGRYRELSETQLEEAVAELRRAIELNPSMARAYNNLGAALDTQGKLADAVRIYQQALELRPNSVNAHMNLGTALVRLGRMDEGLQHLQQAVQLDPDYADAHRNLAVALRRAGRLQEAEQHRKEAERLERGAARNR